MEGKEKMQMEGTEKEGTEKEERIYTPRSVQRGPSSKTNGHNGPLWSGRRATRPQGQATGPGHQATGPLATGPPGHFVVERPASDAGPARLV